MSLMTLQIQSAVNVLQWKVRVALSIGSYGWSMVNACTPQGESILGTGGGKKNKKICTLVSHAISIFLTSGKKCRNYQKVYSSDDGISLPLFMVPNLCIDKKTWI